MCYRRWLNKGLLLFTQKLLSVLTVCFIDYYWKPTLVMMKMGLLEKSQKRWHKPTCVDTLLKRNYFHFLMAFTSAGALRLNSSIYDHLIYECTFLLPTHLCAVFPVSQFRYQPPVFLPLLFVFCSFCCLCTNMSACLPGSQQVRGLYLITARLNSLRQ